MEGWAVETLADWFGIFFYFLEVSRDVGWNEREG